MKKLIFAMAAFCLTAGALTIKEKKTVEDWNTRVKTGHLEKFKTECGTPVTYKLDEKAVAPFMAAHTDFGAFCDEVISAISHMCKDATAKTAITGKLKSVSCMNGSGKAEFKMSGSDLQVSMSPQSTNLNAETKKFLENNL